MLQPPLLILKRAGILILSFYLLLYMFPFPLDQIPLVSDVLGFYSKAIDFLGLWLGKSILHIRDLKKIEMTGSGDTTLDYVRILLLLALSALLTVVVMILDRKKRSFKSFYSLVIVYARYYLGMYMLVYGIGKIFTLQFPPPSLSWLDESYGNSSPMRLLWAFMGSSKPYSAFSGFMEVIGGSLVLFRRTKAPGALVSAAVMMNVALMNFCYDVPVKLFSTHLVLISLLILGPDLLKIIRYLLRMPQAPLDHGPYLFDKTYKKRIYVWGKAFVVTSFAGITLFTTFSDMKEMDSQVPNADLDGIYKSTSLVLDKDTLVSLHQPPVWRKLLINEGGAVTTNVYDSTTYYAFNLNTKENTIQLVSYKDSLDHLNFSYVREKDKLVLKGKWRGKQMEATFRKRNENTFLLTHRGFHWINEYPFNR